MKIGELSIHRYRHRQDAGKTLCPECREREVDERRFILHCPALNDLKMEYIIPRISWVLDDPFMQLLCEKDNFEI